MIPSELLCKLCKNLITITATAIHDKMADHHLSQNVAHNFLMIPKHNEHILANFD